MLPDAAFFSHQTAAALYGAPLPAGLEDGQLHVCVAAPVRASKRRGVVWHQLSAPLPVRARGRLRAVSPAWAWCQLAGTLSLHDLVAAGDYFVTGDQPIHRNRVPLSTLAELQLAVRQYGAGKGVQLLREALALVRYGSMSRPETHTRLLLVEAGLPEPSLNFEVVHPLRNTRYVLDLAYPELKIGLDYEGDYHRTDARQFRKDIRRRERLAELGWHDIRVTADDLEHHRDEFVARVQLYRARSRAQQHTHPSPIPTPIFNASAGPAAPGVESDARLRKNAPLPERKWGISA